MALANFADDKGFSAPDLSVLSQRSRLGERRAQQVLRELQRAGQIACVQEGRGRGNPSVYQILRPSLGEADFTFSPAKKVKKRSPLATAKGEGAFTVSDEKVNVPAPFPEKVNEPAPFGRKKVKRRSPSGPQKVNVPAPFPGSPGKDDSSLGIGTSQKPSESSSSAEERQERPLTASQQACREVRALFAEAGMDAPSPGQIGAWLREMKPHGGLPRLVSLIQDLVGAQDLPAKKNPRSYLFRVIKELGSSQRQLPATLAAGADDTRRSQASNLSRQARSRAAGEGGR